MRVSKHALSPSNYNLFILNSAIFAKNINNFNSFIYNLTLTFFNSFFTISIRFI